MKRTSIWLCFLITLLMIIFSTGFIETIAGSEIAEEDKSKKGKVVFVNTISPLETDELDKPQEAISIIDENAYKEIFKDEKEILKEDVVEEGATAKNATEQEKSEEVAVLKNVVANSFYSENKKVEEKIISPVTTFKGVYVEPIPENYVEAIKMVSTAYCHCKKCCGKDETHPAYGLTYSGVNLLDGKVHKVIAADIKVLPLGTVVYIKDYGIATVADIGGGVKGEHVDVYFPNHDEALDWDYGMQEIDVYVLKYPEKK